MFLLALEESNKTMKWLILFIPLIANAQTNHNEPHKAIEKAINNQLGAECVKLIRNGYITVTGGMVEHADIQVQVDIECLRNIGRLVEIRWKAPTLREDGTVLSQDEIGGYLLSVNDETIKLDTPFYKTRLQSGEYIFHVQTYDTKGNKSQPLVHVETINYTQ